MTVNMVIVIMMKMVVKATMTKLMTTLSYLKGKGKASFPAHKEGKVGQGLKSRHVPDDDHDDLIRDNNHNYEKNEKKSIIDGFCLTHTYIPKNP